MEPHRLITALIEASEKSLAAHAKEMAGPTFQGTLHKFVAGQTRRLSRDSAEKIAKHFRIPVDALYDTRVAAVVGSQLLGAKTPPSVAGMAQPVSFQEFTLPPLFNREQLMDVNTTLPQLFRVVMPDDALHRTHPRGVELIMERVSPGAAVKPGKVILARSASQVYVRKYGEGIGSAWRALATNDAFIPLESERDGLELLAVLRWVEDGDE